MAILHFQLDSYGHPANLGRTLREFGQQVHIAVASESATMPVDLDETHGVIVSGGGASTGASTAAIEAWVRGAAAAEIPVLGIGAGSRLVARALGGEVAGASERGLVKVTMNGIGREEPLFAGQRWAIEQPVMNDEVIAKLPEGARGFGSTAGSRFAAWGLGPWVVGIDWHPEWDAATIVECAKGSGGATDAATQDILRLGRLFAERASLILMPVDRMVAGRAKDVRH